MNTKNAVDVIIDGKQYTLSGYESNEYLQKVATYINDKINEVSSQDGYSQLEVDMKKILLAINISDDYYKAQKVAEDVRQEKEELEKEIFNMKHDMIAMKEQFEEREKEIQELSTEKEELEHKVIRLETELSTMLMEDNSIASTKEEAVKEESKEEESKKDEVKRV